MRRRFMGCCRCVCAPAGPWYRLLRLCVLVSTVCQQLMLLLGVYSRHADITRLWVCMLRGACWRLFPSLTKHTMVGWLALDARCSGMQGQDNLWHGCIAGILQHSLAAASTRCAVICRGPRCIIWHRARHASHCITSSQACGASCTVCLVSWLAVCTVHG